MAPETSLTPFLFLRTMGGVTLVPEGTLSLSQVSLDGVGGMGLAGLATASTPFKGMTLKAVVKDETLTTKSTKGLNLICEKPGVQPSCICPVWRRKRDRSGGEGYQSNAGCQLGGTGGTVLGHVLRRLRLHASLFATHQATGR